MRRSSAAERRGTTNTIMSWSVVIRAARLPAEARSAGENEEER